MNILVVTLMMFECMGRSRVREFLDNIRVIVSSMLKAGHVKILSLPEVTLLLNFRTREE